jgi:hypothetical protein
MEFSCLRDEYLRRMEMKQKIVELTITIAAAIFGIALTKEASPSLSLIYPPIATFLALGWILQNDVLIMIAKYIREKLEPKDGSLGWEKQRLQERKEIINSGRRWRYAAVSHIGVFIFSEIMAIFIGITKITNDHGWVFNSTPTWPILFVLLIDAVCIGITLFVLWPRIWFKKASIG